MATFTIELPATFGFESRGATYTTEGLDKLPATIVANLALHGLQQKLADSLADKAKVAGKEAEVVAAVFASLVNGEWSRRGKGNKPALGELDSIIWDLIEKAVRETVMAEHKVKQVKALTDEQHEEIAARTQKAFDRDEVKDRVRPVAEQELAARKAKQALGGIEL